MPPLPDAVVATLKADPCAALAALMIISNAHSGLLAWAQRSLSPLNVGNGAIDRDAADKSAGGPKAGVEASKPKPRKANGSTGVRKSRSSFRTGFSSTETSSAKEPHNPREGAAKHDEALLALMQANPHATVTEIIRMNGRPRNSTVLSLERLEKPGLVEHAGRGKWKAVDPDLLEVPGPNPRIKSGGRTGSNLCRANARRATPPTGGCATS